VIRWLLRLSDWAHFLCFLVRGKVMEFELEALK
jgi:hypothetical protein